MQIEGFAPTALTTGGQVANIPTGELLIQGFAPTALGSNPVTVEIPTGELQIQGFAPTAFATLTPEMTSSTVYCERVVEVVKFTLKRKRSSGSDTFHIAHDYWDAGTLYGGSPVIYPVLAAPVLTPRSVDRTLGIRHDVGISVFGRSHMGGYEQCFFDLADTHVLHGAEVEVKRYFKTHDGLAANDDDVNIRQTMQIVGYSWSGDTLSIECRDTWFEDKELSKRLLPENFVGLEENYQYQYGAIVFGQGGDDGVVVDAPYIYERDSSAGTPEAEMFCGHTFPNHPMQGVQKVFVRNPLTDLDSRDWLDVGFAGSASTAWNGSVTLSDAGDQAGRHLSLFSRGVVISPSSQTRLLSTVMAQIRAPQGYWSAAFDGINDVLYVIDPSGLSFGDKDFDFGGFIRFSTLQVGGIVGKGETGTSDGEWGLLMDNSNQLRFFISTNGTSRTHEVTSAALSANTWYHVRCWHDSAADTINISINNGTPVSQATSAAVPFKGDGPLQFGFINSSGLTNYFHGRMCHWGVWNGITGSTERASIYNSGNGRAYEDLTDGDRVKLVSWWDMSEFNRRRDDNHSSRHLNDAGDVSSLIGRVTTTPDPARGEIRLIVSRARYLPDTNSWGPEASPIISTPFDVTGAATAALTFGYPIAFPVNPIIPLVPGASYFVWLEFTNFNDHPYSFRSNYLTVGGQEHYARINTERGQGWERQANVQLGMALHIVGDNGGFSATKGSAPYYASYPTRTYTGVYAPVTLSFPAPSAGVQYKFGMRGLLDNGSGTYTGSASASIRNFADVLRFALMNSDFGRGLTSDEVDVASFNAARSWGNSNGVYLSFAIDRELFLSELVTKVCEQTTAILYKTRIGKLRLHTPSWHGGQFDYSVDEGRHRDAVRVQRIDDNPGAPLHNDYVVNFGVDALGVPKSADYVYRAGSNAFSQSLQINGTEASFADPDRVAWLAGLEALYGKTQFRRDFDLFGPEATDAVLKILRRIVDRYSDKPQRVTIRVPLKDYKLVDLFDTFAVRHTDIPLEGGTTDRFVWTDDGEAIEWDHDGIPISWMKLGRIDGEVVQLLEIDQSVEITVESMHSFS